MSAQTSPVRPTRRAAAKKHRTVDSSDEENEEQVSVEDDYTPAPAKSARSKPRVSAAQSAQSTPAPRPRVPRIQLSDKTTDNVFSPPQTLPPSTRKTPATARRSVRAGRKSLLPDVPDSNPPFPTPDPSQSPDPTTVPLSDITRSIVNAQAQLFTPISEDEVIVKKEPIPTILEDFEPTNPDVTQDPPAPAAVDRVVPSATALEKPMDIVVRARAKPTLVSQEPDTSKPRMVITYLILNNFKSYAGRQEVGPFHSSFSSVVGPNGSGKSNVIDSLLFVFGFRASKMRQGKISALIHNSAAYPDLDFCEVQVHFQQILDLPDGTKEILPDSNLMVSRKAFKNNASKYYINDKESNFTNVTTLLRGHGVDLDHKRFLILQGEVESIAQMKPKAANEHDDGLLEYLEDIIGTSKYKTPIEESATETDTLNDVCQEKNGRVQHVEKEKKGLESKKNAALAYIKDENDLSIKQSALWQIFVHECEDNILVTEEAVGQQKEQLDAELERHRGGEEEIKQLEKQFATEAKSLTKLESSTQSVLKELVKVEKESVKFDEKKKHLHTKVKKLEKTISTSNFSISETTTQLQHLADDLKRNATSIDELEQDLQRDEQELTEIRDNLKGKTQGISNEIGQKQKLLEPFLQQINVKNSAIALTQSELSLLKERDNAGAQALSHLQSKIVQLQQEKVDKDANLKEYRSEQKTLEAEVKSVQTRLDNLGKTESTIRSKLSDARQKADEAKASLANSQTQGTVLSSLMRLEDSGRITGFHGRLGNLGSIDQKYDVAISTACPALENLVVDTVEVGQQCIEHLRKNKLGRANFILLDRLSQRDLSAISTPENVPRLFDLVRSKDSKFDPAFYSVLQNTLIAENLEQANRVAYGAKRWRVVTLDGQLIDKSGTMSGGGTRVAKGAMTAKMTADTTKEQVIKLEDDREVQERQMVEFQEQQRILGQSLKDAKHKIPVLETEIQKCMLEIGSLERNLADAQRSLDELNTTKEPASNEKARCSTLEKTISSLEADIENIQAKSSGLEDDIKALQDKIMEIGGVKLRGQKAKVDGLKEQINTLQEESSNAEVGQAKAEKQKIKLQKAIEDASAELENITIEQANLEQEIANQCRDSTGSKKQAEEAKDALDMKKEEIAAVRADLDQRISELNETRGIEIEMRNRLEENQKILMENQKRFKYWEEKLAKLQIQSVSDLGENHEEQTIPIYTRDELSDLDKNILKAEIAVLEEKTQNANVELGVLGEYRKRVEEHLTRSSDLAEAVAQRDAAKKRCEEMRSLRLEGFMEGFSTISLRLKEMYQMITMGGNAELELVDSLDPFSEGILFSVMPPKKSWKNISNLSGGEKTLSSLALVFALHHYKPTPLYVMDEIDAALDFRNVSIVASYIKERTKNAQFIVISLRNNMFELASRLVGVYKVNHMTKSVTVENRDFIQRT